MTAITILTAMYVGYRIARAFARAGDVILQARRDFGGVNEWEQVKRDLEPSFPRVFRP